MKNLIQSLEHAAVSIGRHRLRRELLKKNDRLLEDLGFSRERLEEGVDAWPWRLSPEDRQLSFSATLDRREARQAIAKLQAYSDRELNDLGLARGDIEHVVHHGRPGYPEGDRLAA